MLGTIRTAVKQLRERFAKASHKRDSTWHGRQDMAEFDPNDFFKDKPGDGGGQSSGGATGIFGPVEEQPAAPVAPAAWPPPVAEAAKPAVPSVHEVKFHAPGSGDPGNTDPLQRILNSMPASPAATAYGPSAAEPVYTPPAPAPTLSVPSTPSAAAPPPANVGGGGFPQMVEALKKPAPPTFSAPSVASAPAPPPADAGGGGFTQMFEALKTPAPAPQEPPYAPPAPPPTFSAPSVASAPAPPPTNAGGAV